MPLFEYIALDGAGVKRTGSLAAVSEAAVLTELEARKLSPVSVAEKRARKTIRRGVSSGQLALSYVQLADLLRAGVPLLRGLRLLARKKSGARLAAAYGSLAEAVAEGEELAEAMGKTPEVFPRVHAAMVRAGEKGGFLEDVLARLGAFVSQQSEMRAKILGALIYPAALVLVGVAVLGIVFGVFVPKFKPLFERIDELPAVTLLLFGIADAVGKYAPITLALLTILLVGVWRASKREDVRRLRAHIRLKLPVLGPLTRALAAARFCRMLGTLLGNGVPMIASMEIARESAGNMLMEETIERATEAVRAGEKLADPLAEGGMFEEDVVEMISVAESANNLDTVLITIAETIERRVDRLLGAAVKLIEPLLIVAMACVIAFVAAGLILPMVELSAAA